MAWTGFMVLMSVLCLSQAQRRDPCLDHECENGGTCSFPLDYPICLCPSGFYGQKCQNVTDVKPGQCGQITMEEFGNRRCDTDFECPSTQKCCNGITGGVCTSNIKFDPCHNYCENDGNCSAPADAPTCTCPSGFVGDQCQIPTIKYNSACPVIEPGMASVCGGTFCSSDEGCSNGWICCASACGRNLCTPKPEPRVTTPPPSLTCANVLCNVGTVCRHVVAGSKCQQEPRCLPARSVQAGTDDTCKRSSYSEAILVESNDGYSALSCGSRPGRCSCPSDSACVDDDSGRAVCCRGRSAPVDKPGSCPAGNISICGGIFCASDSSCPGDQKCCPGCGSKLCTNPVQDDDLCDNKRCLPGEICMPISRPCAPGRFCALDVISICVPRQCQACPSKCQSTATGHKCPDQPVDSCGGCPRDRECRDTGLRCITTPCPSHRCLLKNPLPCFKTCSPGFTCELQPAQCDDNSLSCRFRLVPTCLPQKPRSGQCPNVFPLLTCITDRFRRRCSADDDCPRQSQKCCPSTCGYRVCRTTSSLSTDDDD